MRRPIQFSIAAVATFILAMPGLSVGADAPKSLEPKAAAEPKAPDQPEAIKLVLHPAKPPAAALEYPLLPRFSERMAGNAAPIYLKAITIVLENKVKDDYWTKVDQWLETSPAKLPLAEVRAVVRSWDGMFHNLSIATRRDRCDWDPPIRDDPDVFGILLPEWQQMRGMARLVALKARLEIAEGRPADALATLKTGYQMARDVGNCPFLVAGLVGIAISRIMDQQVLELMQSRDFPNLYWSLTALPNPLIDLRPALDFESESIFFALPELRGIESADHSPAEWDRILARLVQRYGTFAAINDHTALADAALIAGKAIVRLPQAKMELIAAGRDRKTVEAMPASQVILLDAVMTYKEASDEMFKWFNVPYWQSGAGFAAVDRHLMSEVRDREIIPLASLLLPAIGNVRKATARSGRQIDLLRTIEALRFYAAEHDGKLPASLSDIKEVPVPDDPVSGKPFVYKLSDGVAQLDAPPPAGETWQNLGVRYEIRIADKK